MTFEIGADRQMSNDPVWLADNVMAFLLDRRGDAPDKSLLQSKIEADYDGKAFPFTIDSATWLGVRPLAKIMALSSRSMSVRYFTSICIASIWKAHLPNTPFTLSAPSRMASGRAC